MGGGYGGLRGARGGGARRGLERTTVDCSGERLTCVNASEKVQDFETHFR
jgi:hypothetical protein